MSVNDPIPLNINQPLISKAYLEPADIDRLQEATTNLRDCLLIRLLFRLGCRVSEALGIKLKDVDLVNCTITIQHLKARLKIHCPHCDARLSRSHTYCPKCGASVEKAAAEEITHLRIRILPIDAETLGILKQYFDDCFGLISPQENHLIFSVSRHWAWQIVRDCAVKAQLPKLINPETGRIHNVSPHKLQDAFAVHAIKVNDSGDGLRLLQEHLGHASFYTTARYRKISGDEHKKWYQKLCKYSITSNQRK
jgi:integrase/recombinase XerD